MSDLNHVILIGRLTRDAETPAGDRGPVKLSLAVNRRKKQGDQYVEEGNFFDVEYWHRSILPHLVRGKQIAVDGELRQERWEQDGQKRSKIVVVAQDIKLLGGGQSNPGGQGGASISDRSPPASKGDGFEDDGFGDDIPF